jgi:transcriptional regulator with XRE-family HTH domain
MDDIRQVLKESIKFYRKKKGITQQKLAEACDVTTPYIGEIEIGRKYISLQMVETLCRVLDVEPWKLFVGPTSRDESLEGLLSAEARESVHRALDDALGFKPSHKV